LYLGSIVLVFIVE